MTVEARVAPTPTSKITPFSGHCNHKTIFDLDLGVGVCQNVVFLINKQKNAQHICPRRHSGFICSEAKEWVK